MRRPIPEPAAPAPPARSLGAAIRAARQEAGLTLARVAELSELSISYLSQVERDLLTPSVSALKRIADALRIPAGSLMFAPGGLASDRAVAVVRRDGRKKLAFPQSDIRYEMVTPDMRRRSSVLWLNLPPGAESGEPFAHEGEDCVLVLKGSLDVEAGGVWHRLENGDSITFNSLLPHRWRNPGRDPVEAIWVSTPPSF